MANRVTVEEVREIFNTKLEDDSIAAAIRASNLLVTQICTSSTLSDDLLKEIERYISAHFCNLQDPIALRTKIGEYEDWTWPAAVTTAWSKGLSLSIWGQQAIALDSSGALAKIGLMKASYKAAPREDSANYTKGLTK